MKNQRKFHRYGISFPVECKPLFSHLYFYTVSKDLSIGGLKIISKDFLSKDSLIKLNVNLIDRILDIKAKIAWCNNGRASERYISGIEFVEMNQISKIELFELISEIETMNISNSNRYT